MIEGPRSCRPAELGTLVATATRVFRPDGGDMGADLPLLFAEDNLENLRVVVQGAAVVAHAGFLMRYAVLGAGAPAIRVACIGAVFTVPGWTGHGLASAAVSSALTRARQQGAALVLVSGERGLYRRLGFLPMPALLRLRWPAGAPRAPAVTDIGVATPGDVPELAGLHAREPIRFSRAEREWAALIQGATVIDAPSRTWRLRHAGAMVAALVVQHRAVGRRIVEVLGDRAAIAEALPGVADEALVPSSDAALVHEAEVRGWQVSPLPFPASFLWVDRPVGDALPWYGASYV